MSVISLSQLVAAASVNEPEEDTELIPESPCNDEKLCEVRSSKCPLASELVGEARSAKQPNMLQKREC